MQNDADLIVGVAMRGGKQLVLHAVMQEPGKNMATYYCRPAELVPTVDFPLGIAVTCDDCKAKLRSDLLMGVPV